MDDGTKHGSGLRLHTQSFTLQEVDLLMNVLSNNFNLICSKNEVKNNKYILYISSKSLLHLRFLILPYMHKSMLYKLGL